jgi:hypothetical protein
MERRFPVGWAIFAFSMVMLVIGYQVYFAHPDVKSSNPFDPARITALGNIDACPSDIQVRLSILYDNPPIYLEEYRMRDADGVSTSMYRIRGYSGKQVTVSALPREVTDVSFLFGSAVQDGIWKLTNKPPRGNTDVHYTLYVRQTAMVHVGANGEAGSTTCQTGDRTITFTDPHYWATTAGRQFQIDLGKGAPKSPNDLLKLQSTSLADPRFEQIVNDFRNFGPDSFRAKISAAQAIVRSAK